MMDYEALKSAFISGQVVDFDSYVPPKPDVFNMEDVEKWKDENDDYRLETPPSFELEEHRRRREFHELFDTKSLIQTTADDVEKRGVISAKVLAELLKDPECNQVYIRNAYISDSLELADLKSPARICFEQCRFEGSITLSQVEISAFEMSECSVGFRLDDDDLFPIEGSLKIKSSKLRSVSLEYTTFSAGFRMEDSAILKKLELISCNFTKIRIMNSDIRGDFDIGRTSSNTFEAISVNFSQQMELKWVDPYFNGECIVEEHYDGACMKSIDTVKFTGCRFKEDCKFAVSEFFILSECKLEGDLYLVIEAGAAIRILDCRIERNFYLPTAPEEKDVVNCIELSGSYFFNFCFPETNNDETGETVTANTKDIKKCIDFFSRYPVEFKRIALYGGLRFDHQFPFGSFRDEEGFMGVGMADTSPLPLDSQASPIFKSLSETLSSQRVEGQYSPYCTFAVSTALEELGMRSEAIRLRYMAADNQLKDRKGPLSRAWRIISKYTIGHGYHLTRAIGLLIGVWVIAALFSWWATSKFSLVGDAPQDAPGFWGFLYALDIVASPIGTGQSELWIPSVWWVALILWVLKLLAWGLGAMFIAGLTGLTNREILRE